MTKFQSDKNADDFLTDAEYDEIVGEAFLDQEADGLKFMRTDYCELMDDNFFTLASWFDLTLAAEGHFNEQVQAVAEFCLVQRFAEIVPTRPADEFDMCEAGNALMNEALRIMNETQEPAADLLEKVTAVLGDEDDRSNCFCPEDCAECDRSK